MLNRPNLITMNGHGGAGKTTACTKLASELDWEHFYGGMGMRKLAEKRGVSIGELRVMAEKDKSIDLEVDAAFADLAKSGKPYIAEGRTAWYLLPDSFKVMFYVPLIIGAERMMASDKRVAESYRDLASAVAAMKARRISDVIGYRNSYGIENNEDFNHFNLVLDTSYSSPDRNVSFIRAAFSLWQKGIALPRVWMGPKSLVPTKSIMKLSDKAAVDLQKKIEKSGYDSNQPITGVMIDDRPYIIDGHLRVSAALRAGCDFVPVNMMDGAALKQKASAADIDAWENAHGFKFVA